MALVEPPLDEQGDEASSVASPEQLWELGDALWSLEGMWEARWSSDGAPDPQAAALWEAWERGVVGWSWLAAGSGDLDG